MNNDALLRIAVTKGRLLEKSIGMFERAGADCAALRAPGRRLTLPVLGNIPFEVVLAKAPDVITYVEHGVCDFGIVGKDTILELGSSFYEVLDLRFGACRFVLAVPDGTDFFGGLRHRTVATKYPNVTRNFLEKKGVDADIVKIEGSVELAPILGLADGIVDIVETGGTLRENGLAPIEDVAYVSARLIANIAAVKTKKALVTDFINMCKGAL
ncbi:MAG: ATP phosphoribosyltransferase [Oscillospiraceae bacterium]|jgi:ATP phosphoribosyltransferase|nr:ATP phosphoribosyltransferase [Oscillospiraceae bacterium]